MKNEVLHLFLLLAVSLTICSCVSKQNGLNKQSDLVKQSDLDKQNPLNSEAQAEAKRFWDNRSVKCGDSYYAFGSRDYSSLSEFKSFAVSVVEITEPPTSPKPLSEADKLNQIEERKTANKYNTEWDGYIKLNVGANRRFISNYGGWQEWQDKMPVEIELHGWIRLTKVNGRWLYSPANKSLLSPDEYSEFIQKLSPKMDCSRIKK